MPDHEWPKIRAKIAGITQTAKFATKFPSAFIIALREFCRIESERTGRKVSMSAVLMTSALKYNHKLDILYRRAVRESE
jgi:hypothetical protein